MSRPRPKPWRAAGLGLAAALLVACSAGQAPQPAQFVAPQPAMAELGQGLVAHYNLFPTTSMSEAVARQYGVQRASGRALLVVALRQRDPASGQEHPAQGSVQAQATGLAGQRRDVELRAVQTGPYTDHIGVVHAGDHDVIRIAVTVKTASQRSSFEFQRNF